MASVAPIAPIILPDPHGCFLPNPHGASVPLRALEFAFPPTSASPHRLLHALYAIQAFELVVGAESAKQAVYKLLSGLDGKGPSEGPLSETAIDLSSPKFQT